MKKSHLSWKIILCFVSIFSLGIIKVYSQTQSVYGLIIEPSTFYIKTDPGDSYSSEVHLTNDFETRDVTIYPTVATFDQKEESGVPVIQEGSQIRDIESTKWLNFDKSSYTLNNGDSITPSYTIEVPKDAEPGGYYFALIFGTDKPSEIDDSNTIGINQRNSALVLLTVNGDIDQNGSLLDFYTFSEDTSKEVKFFDFAPVNFAVTYSNEGNVHSQVAGNIFIHRGNLKEPIDTLKVNEEVGYTLPQKTRKYTEEWNYGWITIKDRKIRFNKDQFGKILLGKYQATLKLIHDKNNVRTTSESTIEFNVFPWELLIILIVIAGGIYTIFRPSETKENKKE